jgi:hypothetical protein
MEMLVLVFVLSASSIALAIVLAIVGWQEEQKRIAMQMARMMNGPRYSILTATSSLWLSKPLPKPTKLILQEKYYR